MNQEGLAIGRLRRAFYRMAPPFIGALPLLMGIPASGAGAASQPGAAVTHSLRLYCAEADSPWQRARFSGLAEYCAEVFVARAGLARDPIRTEQRARAAQKLRSDGLEAALLLSESLLLQGQAEAAHQQFVVTLGRARPSDVEVLSTLVLLSAARAAMLSCDYATALSWYRKVVLQIEGVQGPRERARVLLEAATAAGYQTQARGQESRSYLSLALRQNAPLLQEVVVASWVASLLRDGQVEQARQRARNLPNSWGIAFVVGRHRPSTGRLGEILPVFPPGEGAALVLAVAALSDPESAALHGPGYTETVSPEQVPAHIWERSLAWAEGQP